MTKRRASRERPTPRSGDDIDQVFESANPNPQRVGCLSAEVLASLAERALPMGHPAYEHLAYCSICYRKFRRLQQRS